METFDYVIVGAGSAGSVLASRLSEDENVTVCVLEAGPWDWHPFIHIPAGFMYTLVNPKVNWLYKSEPSEWTGGRAIAAPRGKTLGGSSSINGHIYNRGQRLDFDGWAQRGNRGWGYADVLPYFRRSERRVGEADDTFRGRDGNLPITDLEWRDPICEAFIEGAVQLGIPRNRDYNGTMQAGDSIRYKVFKDGVVVLNKLSAELTYLASGLPAPAYGATGSYRPCVTMTRNAVNQGAEVCGTAWVYPRPMPPVPTVNPPTITPASVTVPPGQTVTFTVTRG